jgi:hypothetical protein
MPVGPYSRLRSAASSLFRKNVSNCASFSGSVEFHRSFWVAGMMTSLTSGLPRRDTCCHAPRPVTLPPPMTVTRWRSVAA